MKKFYIPYILFCIVSLILLLRNLTYEHKTNDYVYLTKEISPYKIKKTYNIYTIKSLNEDIVVFDKNDELLFKLNIDYKTLRDYDRKKFDIGIKVYDINALSEIIEDFSN